LLEGKLEGKPIATATNKGLAKCGVNCKVELLCILSRQKPILLAF